MSVFQLGNPTVYDLEGTGDEPTADGKARPFLQNTKDLADTGPNPDKDSNNAYAFLQNEKNLANDLDTQPDRDNTFAFAKLLTWPVIYDLGIPPIPQRGILYPQFVRTINNG